MNRKNLGGSESVSAALSRYSLWWTAKIRAIIGRFRFETELGTSPPQ